MVVAADELVGRGHAYDVADARHGSQVERSEVSDIADQADDRALDSATDERLSADGFDPLDDSVHLVRAGTRSHDDDHGAHATHRPEVSPRAGGRMAR
jgi:hypothetical protein